MNVGAFLRNVSRANEFCRSAIDKIKYLVWLYGNSSGLIRGHRFNLRLKADFPLGQFSLEVRSNGGSDAFIFSEVFEHRYYDFDLASEPATILDLGANIGLTSLFFARKYPEAAMACVEPMPDNVTLLRHNLEHNGVRARIFANAVAVQDGPIVMQIAANDYGHKILDSGGNHAPNGDTLRVEGISVPTILKQMGWTRIELLKVDIEGYENVLLRERCEWLECVDVMCIECHDGYGEDDLEGLAQRFGFAPPKRLKGTILMVRDLSKTPAAKIKLPA